MTPGRVVGVLAIAAIAWITWNTLSTEAPGGKGLPAGATLPRFAAPLASSSLEGDANVDPARACEVRGRDVVSSCELTARGPVVVGFFITRSRRCEEQVDVLARLAKRFPRVGVVAVSIRGEREDAVRPSWDLPVAWDRDGAVANLYAVSVCPTITLAHRGGRVAETLLGVQGYDALARRVRALEGG
jgi:hypothetical protein